MNNKKNFKKIIISAFNLFISDALAVLFLTLFSIALGRWFGTKILGEYSLAITLSYILRTLADAGYDLKISRLIAAKPETINTIIVEAQYIKLKLWLLLFLPVIYAGLTLMNGLDFIIMIFWVIPCIIANTFRSALRGMLQMKFIAIVESVNNFLLTIFLFIALFIAPKLYLIFLAHLLFEFIKVFHYTNIFRKKFNLPTKLTVSFKNILSFHPSGLTIKNNLSQNSKKYSPVFSFVAIIKEQFRLAAVTLLDVIQIRLPAILLGWLSSLHFVGIFTASQRFISVLRIIPNATFSTLLPDFSSKKYNKVILLSSLLLSFIIGTIISISIFFLSETLIYYTFAFDEAIFVLKILSWSFIFLMMNNVLQAFILSCGLENVINIILTISIITIILLSLFLFPYFGAIGAAFTVVASECFIFIMYFTISAKLYFKFNVK